ncbi:MAG: hypothetical protein ACFFBD_02960 [Candidatus Hodarchaeota archaeon]
MKPKYLVLGIILLFLACFSCLPILSCTIFSLSISEMTLPESCKTPPLSCTIISQAIGDTVLFGNNEDYLLFGTYMWFAPAQSGAYGAVYFGFNYNNHPADGYAQGGMNTKGLSCDGNGLPEAPLNPHPDRLPFSGPFMESVLKECATVNETKLWCETHNFGSAFSGQIHFADAYGDSVVVSAGSDQELAFTRKNNSNYLVSTNFNLANHNNGWYPCWRYNTADRMLKDIKNETDLTIEAFRDILDAVHQGGTYATKYSNIFDLKTREIYVYYNHDFTEFVKLNLIEELAKGAHEYRISELFNPSSLTSSSSSMISTIPTTPSVSAEFFTLEIMLISLVSLGTILWKRRKRSKS